MEVDPGKSDINRDTPEPSLARKALVDSWIEKVQQDLKHWGPTFELMKRNQRFARGMQWTDKVTEVNTVDGRYVANIVFSHIKNRVASLYARNPRFRFRKSQRMNYKFWNGTASQLQVAQMSLQSGIDISGRQALIVQEAIAGRQKEELVEKMGETLTLLYSYFIREQSHPTKKMMKKLVTSALTCSVGYVKQTFSRTMSQRPDVEQGIADHRKLLEAAEQIADDVADDLINESSAEVERLSQIIQNLEQEEHIVLREGLSLTYPSPTSIIPDRAMTWLPEFIGCGHVTEQYLLTPERVQQVYGVSVHKNFTAYTQKDNRQKTELELCKIWEIWSKVDNMIYVVCDGYPDFLVEPAAPDTYTERFWPWFAFAPNVDDDDEMPFPNSDVDLMRHQQLEVNNTGESLRQHRKAARPRHVTGTSISPEERAALQGSGAHSITELRGLGKDEDIRKRFQSFPVSPIDPNLYSNGPFFTDIQRVLGTQEANFGGTSGDTATESSIAESGRQSREDSSVDDLDTLLSDLAKAGGQILMQEMSEEGVKEIVGPAAVWTKATRSEISKDIFLEVEAGSSGHQNTAHEVQIRERLYPHMMQVSGLDQEWLLRDMLKTLDDNMDYDDAIDLTQISVLAQNGLLQAKANQSGDMEGQGGSANAPAPAGAGPEGPPGAGQSGFGGE